MRSGSSKSCAASGMTSSRITSMAKLIRNRRAAADSWRLLKADAEGRLPAFTAEEDVIVPLATWLADKDTLASRKGRTGVWLEAKEGPEALAADVQRLP